METPAPSARSRKYEREVHTRRKPSPGHAHLPEAPVVFLRLGCSLTGSVRRQTGGGVRAEAEDQVGMAEGGSPDGRAGPGPAGNVCG